jgi:F-type H+-transporting ATPase subunit delta
MESRKVVKRYSKGLLESCKNPQIAINCLNELRDINDLIDSDEELQEVLNYPYISRFKELFGEKLNLEEYSDTTEKFINLLIDNDRLKLLQIIIDDFERVLWESQDVNFVVVKSARPLSKDVIEKLKEKLKNKLQTEIKIRYVVEPEQIGSIRIETGDIVIDNSVSGRLERMRKMIIGNIMKEL